MSLISRLHHQLESTPKDQYVEIRTSTSMEELRRLANLENMPLERLKLVERLVDGEFGLLDVGENLLYRITKDSVRDPERGFSTYGGTIMVFEDPEVKMVLVQYIGGESGITRDILGTTGVKGVAGEVTYEQVLACKSLYLLNINNIRRFNELEYFKNLQYIKITSCSELEELSLPYMSGGSYSIVYCNKLRKLTTRYGLNVASKSFLRQTPRLVELDTSNWTCSASNTERMFENCGIETLDLSNFDMSNVTDASFMFANCSRLESIKGRWNLSSLKYGSSMFSGCKSLTTLDTSRWELSSLISSECMFLNCNSLQSLGNTSGWNLSSLYNGFCMFQNCPSLQSLDTSNWGLNSLVNSDSMFAFCGSLSSLDTSRWSLNKISNLTAMFHSCNSLTTLDTANWGLKNATKADRMFYNCTNLVSIDLSDKLKKCSNNLTDIFYNCTNLESIVGNHTETDNVRFFIDYKNTNIEFMGSPRINIATINAVIRGVTNSSTRRLLSLPESVKSQVTQEYKTLLESKNWEIS